MAKLDLKGLLPEELATALQPLRGPAFRGRQVFGWMHRRLAADFAEMTDLPAPLRARLAEEFRLTTLREVSRQEAADGTTRFLFALADENTLESVYIPAATRATVCISSQVGCPFGCRFCATGQSGFVRNLSAAEIVDQVYRVQAALPEGRRISNVVYMGMGEPLANYEQSLRSVRLLLHPLGLNLAQRHITLSTVGITPGIDRLADEGLQVNLAISLHAPTQAGRLKLLPIAKKYPIDDLIAAARRYVHRTGRKVTFEYTVVPGSNDSPGDALQLAALVRGLQALVNVIPLNLNEGAMPGLKLSPPELIAAAERFTALLRGHGVEAALRRSRGEEVTGACGQLRRRTMGGAPVKKSRTARTEP
jgi:23S rRNA (adenine2503-C2)-methyltransferase